MQAQPANTHRPPEESVEALARSFEDGPAQVSLAHYGVEDWAAFAMFWGLCGVVFLQFFTRYALNDSAAWTEEMARYLLVAVVFLGSSMCVRINRHIQVDLIYRYVPPLAGRALATFVDAVRVAFLGYATWLTWLVIQRVGHQQMTMIDWPMSVVQSFVMAGFGFMFVRAVILTVRHLRTGSSILEHPERYEHGE